MKGSFAKALVIFPIITFMLVAIHESAHIIMAENIFGYESSVYYFPGDGILGAVKTSSEGLLWWENLAISIVGPISAVVAAFIFWVSAGPLNSPELALVSCFWFVHQSIYSVVEPAVSFGFQNQFFLLSPFVGASIVTLYYAYEVGK
jgi:hypothetical protein